LWKLVLQWKAGFPIKVKHICCLAHSCNIPNPLSILLEYATQEFQTAQLQYLQLKPDHEILRKEFLLSRLRDPTLTDKHHMAIVHLVKLESLWESYRQVKVLCSASVGHSILAIEYNLPSGSVIAVSWEEVEKILSEALSS